MDLGLKDRVAIVAASSQGLGKAVAMGLAKEGSRLALCARTEATLQQAAMEIRAALMRKTPDGRPCRACSCSPASKTSTNAGRTLAK